MARTGTPLPFSLREKIKSLASDGKTRRAIAAELGVSKTTATKYAPKRGTKLFQDEAA